MISCLHPPDCEAIHFCCSKNNLSGKISVFIYQFSSVQSFSCVQIFATPWTVAHQDSLSITKSWTLLKLVSMESVMPSNHLIFCLPLFSCLQSFPESGSFLMSQFFASGGQSIGASDPASVLPNSQEF